MAIGGPYVDRRPSDGAGGAEPPAERTSTKPLSFAPLCLAALALIVSFHADPLARVAIVPAVIWNAAPIGWRAWSVWRRERRLNIDFLDALAVAVAVVIGDLLTAAMVVFLVTLGEAMRDRTACRSRREIRRLGGFDVASAWVLRSGEAEACHVSALAVGDEVLVHAGEMIPVDGEVVGGDATVDQRALTGESAPIRLAAGDAAWAATPVVEGQLRIRAIRTGDDTAAALVARLVEAAPVGDTRIQRYAERFADRLVLPTLALAFAACLLTGDHRYLLSILVVDFGTGVRVAAPIAVLASMIQAARVGIIFRSGSQIERLGAVDTIVFDKTGTLTTGAQEIDEIISYDPRSSVEALLAYAASVESRSRHPIAAAIRAKAGSLGVSALVCESIEYAIGRGAVGRVGPFEIHVGSEGFMRESGVDLGVCAADCARLDADGRSRVFIAIDGVLAGLASVRDDVRKDSAATIRRLREHGIREIVLLSGDNEQAVRSVASRLGVDRYFAAASPVDKVAVIQALQRQGRFVAMIGDGINDGPALSYANVGIAVKHGAELAHESAGVILADDSLPAAARAIEIARSSRKRINWGQAIVVAWNIQALLLTLTRAVADPAAIALVSDGSAIWAGLYGLSPLVELRRIGRPVIGAGNSWIRLGKPRRRGARTRSNRGR
jgi:Cu2+-exporting ATPase